MRRGSSPCKDYSEEGGEDSNATFQDNGITEKSYAFLNRLSDVIYMISLKVDEEEREMNN